MRGAIHLSVFLLLAAIGVAGCGSPAKLTADAPKTPANGPADPWVLSTNDLSNKTPALLWNGLIGMRLGRDGSGADADGKPLPMFFIDEYQTTGEEKIKPIDSFLQFKFSDGTPLLDPKTAGPYSQSLDMRSGVLKTVWNQPNANTFNSVVQCETIIHPTKRIVGLRWTLESDHPHKGFFIVPSSPIVGKAELFEGESRHTGSFQDGDIQLEVAETRRPTPNSDPRSRVQIPYRYEVVISFGRSRTGRAMRQARHLTDTEEAPNWDRPEPAPTFENLLADTKHYWAKVWQTDIEIDGPVEDQQAVRSFLFYLRSAIHPEGNMSIAPFGLSSSRYNGHVFWDADTWVFPALALIDPERAKAIADYRLSTRIAALNNDTFIQHEQFPARFAWESSVTGEETAPGETRDEIHVTGSVLFSLSQAQSLGLADKAGVNELGLGGANYYVRRAAPLPDGKMGLKDVISPDEFHRGDNDLYTNLIAGWTIGRWGGAMAIPRAKYLGINDPATEAEASKRGYWPVPQDAGDLPPWHLPKGATSFLTYDGDQLRGYKQAAAVLAIYPLQYPPAEKQAKVMMERFADKVTPNGPAMSDSVHALIWARIGERDKAYATWRKSWQRYTSHPLMLFSEKPGTSSSISPSTSGASPGTSSSRAGGGGNLTYFTTGAGGCVQTILYGFLGFRIDSREEMGAAWSKPLLGGQVLSVKPNLPKEWKRITFKNFWVLGKRFTLTADHEKVSVVEMRSSGDRKD